jgi:catechol 2,3-dioxygenase-like lactoylglutathione lyase family enzyme
LSVRRPDRFDRQRRRAPAGSHGRDRGGGLKRAPTRPEVDRLHRELQAIGATIVSGPKLHPEYGPNDYAVFFKDPDGIKYEIVCV